MNGSEKSSDAYLGTRASIDRSGTRELPTNSDLTSEVKTHRHQPTNQPIDLPLKSPIYISELFISQVANTSQ